MLSSTSPVVQLAKASFKRAQRGLFGGKHIQFGNNVPFSKTKTRRTWLPNVQRKRLFSVTLNDWIRLNMTTSVIRTVDKKGGLDRYLLETRPDILGEKGQELRNKIVEALKIKQAKRSLSNDNNNNNNNNQLKMNNSLSPVAKDAIKTVASPSKSTSAQVVTPAATMRSSQASTVP
ncbi:39S ribosomal protein L24, mitochondrial [Modicella reniformis]|uniref:Large ribosomal subunit protein bL28m n=1 Tax=Modicella reniformis TaxID=1440133 RepID=A0A9P6IT98_9FUNG|nr:39S ribosomal protein L24, mitochondrial [Modicella reniformis]